MKPSIQQKIINELCDWYNIPRIKVVLEDEISGGTKGFFSNYEIRILKKENGDSLLHEFMHYCIELFRSCNELEEALCDKIPNGFNVHIKKNNPKLYGLIRRLKK